jgi:hypothetical protein
MANSTAPVYIKPTVAFNRDDTFVFGAWVCTADGAGSFERHLCRIIWLLETGGRGSE